MRRDKVKTEKKCVNDVWKLVQMTDAQIRYTEFFEENIHYLLSLDVKDESQLQELEITLNPVIKELEMYANNGMTFSIDEKTDALIRRLLLLKGKKHLVNKIDEIIKLEYYIE